MVYAGVSNFPAWLLASAMWTSDVRNLYRVEAIQSVFNILQPGLAIEMIPLARKHGVRSCCPTARWLAGVLTGKYLDSYEGPRDDARGRSLSDRYGDDARHETIVKLKSVSDRHGEPMIRLALQWVSEHEGGNLADIRCPRGSTSWTARWTRGAKPHRLRR